MRVTLGDRLLWAVTKTVWVTADIGFWMAAVSAHQGVTM